MTTPVSTVDGALAPEAPLKAEVRSWKAPIALAVFTALYALLIVAAPRGGETTFRISTAADALQLPEWTVSVGTSTWIVFGLLVVLTLGAVAFVRQFRQTPLWLIAAFIVFAIFGFLAWAGAGKNIPVAGLLAGAVGLAIPLIYGALGGVIGERAGVVNIAIEGQLLAGAFTAAVVASLTRQPILGLLAAAVAGMLVAFILAAFAIKYVVDQVIVGVVLNVLVAGLTSFLYSQVLQPNAATLNSPPRFDRLPIPFLSEIPILGPVLFRQTIIVYLMYIAVALVWFGMFRTRWGLRLRAVGEHPQAADTVGIKVNPTRFWNLLLAGAIAGIGGTVFTIGNGIAFNKEMTAGAGFIALAAVIFGQWDPIKATLAALLFGFASSLQNTLSVIGSPVPSEFMLMLPYLVTIFVVAGVVGKSRAPAADGQPYIKG
ncbi:ABC transporter permease [Microbacterium pygmaeum]|uniref:Nucleoside ABC transporter membrane protein n=1 Tax=Microbacterium pygmaeum TaxID=370764 RepID=A0A1G8CZ60_9MICO|nr:ABC transporter permease [Microbacterium pygmaeum]SDH50634.1 nucleoside ABC transporter membrane protein [Microbacterium pygmaeum]